MEQRSEAWFRARAGRIKASQFSRIVTGTGKDSSQWADYATELVAECLRPDEIPDFTGNKHTDRGNELEPQARECFRATLPSGFELREVGFVTRDDEIVGCSPDGMIFSSVGEPVAGLEIKCPTAANHAKIIVDGVLPAKYAAQVHGSMAVTGLDHWYFMSYCPGIAPFILKVEWGEFTDTMADALDRFLVFYAEHRKKILPLLQGNAK